MLRSIGLKIFIGFAAALLTLLIIGGLMYKNLLELKDDNRWVTHTVEVQKSIAELRTGVLQIQSAVRGYALWRDPIYEDLFRETEKKLDTNVSYTTKLTEDNPTQQDRLTLLKPLLQKAESNWSQMIDRPPAPAATVLVGSNQNQVTAKEIFQLLDDMQGEEQRLLGQRQAKAATIGRQTSDTITFGTVGAVLFVFLIGYLTSQGIVRSLRVLNEGARRIGAGDYAHRVMVRARDETGELAQVFNQMADQVQKRELMQAEQDWLKTSLARFDRLFQGKRSPETLGRALLGELAEVIATRHALFYLCLRSDAGLPPRLVLKAEYASHQPPAELATGEGLAGQALVEKKRLVLPQVPFDYIKVRSGLGETAAKVLIIQPAMDQGEVQAILELSFLEMPSAASLALLDQLAGSLGVVVAAITASGRTEELLGEAQRLSHHLQAQQAELSEKNEELEAQTEALRHSELQLQDQQEELRQTNQELEHANEEMQQTNEEMEEKVQLLAEQKRDMERINREIEQARGAVEEKARLLVQSSKYKTDFLSNMSHELRTPLNSLLILSKLLSENPEKNLTSKQVRYAETIHNSGNDLLGLINEVLDLSKIESGTVHLESGEVDLNALSEFIESTFRPVAENKRLDLTIERNPSIARLQTDQRRLQQILKNLLANALKFTESGSVSLDIRPVRSGWSPAARFLEQQGQILAFSVRDTGIGIPDDKKKIIFEAFQQADASAARKHGGTGLGLAISRQLAQLLGGALELKSKVGEGSTFTLFLPVMPKREAEAPPAVLEEAPRPRSAPAAATSAPDLREGALPPVDAGLEDDRNDLQPDDAILLIIEDDLSFARILVDFAREKTFKAVVARSVAQGVALAQRLLPSAITLDLRLPDNEGWVALDRLKHEPRTRHIPIHIISVDEERERSLRQGAVSFLQKPVTKETLDEALNQTLEFINRPIKKLLIIEDDAVQRASLAELIGHGDVASTAVGTAADAFAKLEQETFDCVVLDLGLPDSDGIKFVRQIHEKLGIKAPPIIVYTGKDLTRAEETELRLLSESIVVKSVRSPERLLDETALFLHRVQAKLPEAKRRMLESAQKEDSPLRDRKVLVVDDDVRNIFAITSALESSHMKVDYAESGQGALDFLAAHPETEVVLMDVMMPEMDGFEAIRRIRQLEPFRRIPIISVTAKAMKGDREKCLEVGASDYITKPVDMDQLRSLLRVWLYR